MILLNLFLILSFTAHEFHISKCQIDYAEAEQSLQLTMHIFIDDLEEALRQRGKDQLFICTKKEAEDTDQYIIDYLQDKIQMKVNGELQSLRFVGKEISDDLAAVWCYFEVPGIQQLSNLEISNKLLQEVFEDQKNIVSIIGPKKKKAYFLFNRGDAAESVNF